MVQYLYFNRWSFDGSHRAVVAVLIEEKKDIWESEKICDGQQKIKIENEWCQLSIRKSNLLGQQVSVHIPTILVWWGDRAHHPSIIGSVSLQKLEAVQSSIRILVNFIKFYDVRNIVLIQQRFEYR